MSANDLEPTPSLRGELPPVSDPRPPAAGGGGGGPLAWMARNSVASNLLMGALIFGGLIFAYFGMIKQEVFPEFQLDMISISVAYPGASPEEVEKGITKAIEENVRGIDGVKTVSSTSSEGFASVLVELMLDTEDDQVLSDVKTAVDRITSFPENAEQPTTSLLAFRNQVLSVVVYGDASERSLRSLADQIRDDLLQDDNISTVELSAVRPLEISVNVPRENLRRYNLTLDQVAAAIRAANVEIPAGGIKTDRGEILLRTAERREIGSEFGDILVLSNPDGTKVRLNDIANVDDGFRDTDQESQFNGKPAAMVRVYRVGEQTPLAISDAVRGYIEKNESALPQGVKLAIWNDRSEMYRQRIDLLMRNAYMGLALVLLSLGLFLEIRLAFWVTMGIPISFLGALLFLPSVDVSLNMISLFAFIVTLGIVVDDAIVVGEAVYKRRSEGMSPARAAVVGAQDVAHPVVFSVLTTIVAFSPLLFVPGTMGKFFRNIPLVVILVLSLSLLESLLVLPSHLSHENPIALLVRRGLRAVFGANMGPFGWIHDRQQQFSGWFERAIMRYFVPLLQRITWARYMSVAVGLALLWIAIGWVAGGRINFTFLPKIESDVVFAQLRMPYGTPAAESKAHLNAIINSARSVLDNNGGEEANSRGMFSQVGAANFGGMGRGVNPDSGGHIAEVAVFMKPMDDRKISAKHMAEQWRSSLGDIPGAESLKFTFTNGASGQAPISIQLSHRDVATLENAANELATRMRPFAGVKDVDDGVSMGKRQLNFKLKPAAKALGITETSLARQVRASFFGAEAARQQRGRDEVRVYVRLPKAERTSMNDLEQIMIRTPGGGEVPLADAATIEDGRAYTSIRRENAARIITVEADVEESKTNANKVMAELEKEVLPSLTAKYPGLTYGLGGQQKEQAESLKSLGVGFLMALIAMYGLMAIPFRSYIQPAIIMFAIPFGIVGAIIGHLLMGYDLSILSAMGFVALSGVVVNDSLVLISAINDFRKNGMDLREAVIAGAARRFRPILLTSLTTFLGLAPMILEQSMQARFLIPMALSLGFGVLFATGIILLLVPCVYLIIEDIKALFAPLFSNHTASPQPQQMPAE